MESDDKPIKEIIWEKVRTTNIYPEFITRKKLEQIGYQGSNLHYIYDKREKGEIIEVIREIYIDVANTISIDP